MTISRNFARRTNKVGDPVEFLTLKNPKGYLDLTINKGANGKAVRISNKMTSVNVGLDKIDDLITALREVKQVGVRTSVENLPTYN